MILIDDAFLTTKKRKKRAKLPKSEEKSHDFAQLGIYS